MKINRLHIDNFGCLKDRDISFGEGVNQLFNENGWGKTTLSIFIKAMFYGMAPARENVKMERKKYMPWQGGNFGGWLEFSCDKGDFRIVRSFSKTPEGDEVQLIDLNTNKVLVMPKEELGQWIFGVGKETFEMTAFFPQLNFLSSVNEQISAGVLGLDKLKFDLANVGGALTKIKKEVSTFKKDIVKQTEIERLERQLMDLSQDLLQAEEQLKDIEKQLKEEKEKGVACESDLEKVKKIIEAQEKIFASKKKLEDQLINQNEQLSKLLLKLNSIQKKTVDKKTSPIWAIFGLLIIVAGIVLAVAGVTSWIISGVICVVGLIFCIVPFLVGRKKIIKAEDSENGQVILKEIEECQSSIKHTKDLLASYQGVEQPNNSEFDLQQELVFSSKLSLERLIAQKKAILYQKERLLQEIEQLQDQIAEIKQKNKLVEEKITILQYSYDFLLKAKENVSERFVSPINEGMKELLDKFDMRGREYAIDTNFDIKQVTDGGLKDFEYSSQGYKDILSICMRFLLIGQVFKEEKPCVILDDSLVNLDDRNFQKAKQLLNHFSKQMQILYICCSEDRRI